LTATDVFSGTIDGEPECLSDLDRRQEFIGYYRRIWGSTLDESPSCQVGLA
jgi:hypothetical protein